MNVPAAFIFRKLQSLAGLWLMLYIILHLFTNSQAALLIGDDGKNFISSVNSIQDLPYLPVLEVLILGVPFFIHGLWGIQYALQARFNSLSSDGSKPSLGAYSRNQAYTWQRVSAWLLIFFVILHVVHMRFFEHPQMVRVSDQTFYMLPLSQDSGLSSVAERLGVELRPSNNQGEVMGVSTSFGKIELLMVRDTFKSPLMMILYSIFVIFACFHAFNGLWTGLIKWGVTITYQSQMWMLKIAWGIMGAVMLLGLSTIWLTYWVNLKY